eukprot:scaffold10477_cov49-Phaeocystis_antarctica.AAC.1
MSQHQDMSGTHQHVSAPMSRHGGHGAGREARLPEPRPSPRVRSPAGDLPTLLRLLTLSTRTRAFQCR